MEMYALYIFHYKKRDGLFYGQFRKQSDLIIYCRFPLWIGGSTPGED